jgi:hypothetical protein
MSRARGELLAELPAFVDHVAGGPPSNSSVTVGAEVVRAIVPLRSLAR